MRRRISFGCCAAALATTFLIPVMVVGAGAPAIRRSAPAQTNGKPGSTEAAPVDELDPVVVEGKKLVEDERMIRAWMRRLVGQFSIEGEVKLTVEADAATQLAIQGQGICTGFNPTPAASCEIHLQLPGPRAFKVPVPVDLSSLSTAVILYGQDLDAARIRYMQVDRNGIADPQLGGLSGDTLTSRSPCVNVPQGCRKTTRITAQPDGSLVEMQVEFEVDGVRAMSYGLTMHRVATLPVSPSKVLR
jgi:hypothetical protein